MRPTYTTTWASPRLSLGNDEEAMHHLDTALQICPDMAVAHLNRSGTSAAARAISRPAGRSTSGGGSVPIIDSASSTSRSGSASRSPTARCCCTASRAWATRFSSSATRRWPSQRVGTLIVACQRPLLRVLARCPGIDRLIADKTKLPDHDAQLPMASLPLVFETRLDTIPADVPYVFADEDVVAAWRNRLAEYREFKVGIAWQGSTKYAGDATRSLPLRHFAPLAAVDGVRLFNLQKGFGTEQLANLDGAFPVVDLGPDLDTVGGSFMDTAAVVQNLDLVISSDTSIVHLVGAMGRPLWLLLSTSPDCAG